MTLRDLLEITKGDVSIIKDHIIIMTVDPVLIGNITEVLSESFLNSEVCEINHDSTAIMVCLKNKEE